MSSELIVRCGSASILWEDLMLMSIVVDPGSMANAQASTVYRKVYDHRRAWEGFFVLDNIRRSFTAMDLLDLLMWSRGYRAADPRDKIYNLLGLLNKEEKTRYNITPNYDRQNCNQDVYICTAKACLSEGEHTILNSISSTESIQGLPS